MKKNKKLEDITGVEPKKIDSLIHYFTIYKSVKKGQKSFRITNQLLNSLYKKASDLNKEGLLILTLPANKDFNYRVECILKKEKK